MSTLNHRGATQPGVATLAETVKVKPPAKKSCLALTCGFLSRLSMSYVNPVVRAGVKGTLQPDQLQYALTWSGDAQRLSAENCHAGLEAAWKQQLERSAKGGKPPSLVRTVLQAFGRDLLIAAVWKFVYGGGIVVSASYFVRSLLVFLQTYYAAKKKGEDPDATDGWVLSCCFFMCCLLLSTAMQQMNVAGTRAGLRIRAAIIAAVYNKCLAVDQSVAVSAGLDAVSLVSTDAIKLMEAATTINYLWSGVLEAAAILAVLLGLLGIDALPGLGLLLLLIPVQFLFGAIVARSRAGVVKASDHRVSLMGEFLQAIKLVKAYAWEAAVARDVAEQRDKEVRLMRLGGLVKSANFAIVFVIPPMIALGIFGLYTIDSPLQAAVAFTTLSLFNTIRVPLINLPKCLRSVAEAAAAFSRVQAYLLLPEREASSQPWSEHREIVLKNASYSWPQAGPVSPSAPPCLHNINLTVAPGSLVMVMGPVGSGKSSLLSAILRQMIKVSGEDTVGGKFALVPQTPWVQHGTPRSNILFGAPFDQERYDTVVRACALAPDFEIMTNGDMTEIGERGLSMSGGQRQRLALARAAYSDADTVLLDSPLSAVDNFTGVHIFQHCVQGLFKARGATVILVTHQADLLRHADTVVIMDKCAIAYSGPPDPAELAKHLKGANVTAVAAGAAAAAATTAAPAPDGAAPAVTETKPRADSHFEPIVAKTEPIQDPSRLGAPHVNGYIALLKTVGLGLAFISLCVFVAAQVTRIYSDIWISVWVAAPKGRDEQKYLSYYGGYVGCFLGLLLLRGLVFYTITRGAATRLHNAMFERVLRAPLAFFSLNPLGRVLSSFSRDQDAVDEALADSIHMSVIYIMILGTTVGVVIRVIPEFAAVAGGLALSFGYFFRQYMAASKALKETVGTCNTTLIAHVSESLTGLPVIRAYGAEGRFMRDNLAKLEIAQVAKSNLGALQVWLSVRLDFIGSLLVVATCLLCVGLEGNLTASAAGLALSNSFQILLFFSQLTLTAAEAHAHMAAVERIRQLATEVTQETSEGKTPEQLLNSNGRKRTASNSHAIANAGTQIVVALAPGPATGATASADAVQVVVEGETGGDDTNDATPKTPRVKWPSCGAITFDGVSMSYYANSPLVLNCVTFTVMPGEKIGICGRTGSGKSSLLMMLYRMGTYKGGTITVDGIDVSHLTLTALRRSIALVPQEPVMFTGTVRSNLDPFNEHEDATLWSVLEKCGLAASVRSGDGGLAAPVCVGGSNWSLGQQQLLCLARALLNPSAILLLDEATAALDLETDAKVQAVIRKEFADRTVLTIAHRMDTVIDCDRILVMKAGFVAEFDSPAVLLRDENSEFAKLCRRAGGQYHTLRRAAEAHYAKAAGKKGGGVGQSGSPVDAQN